jgi:TolA-binding protein
VLASNPDVQVAHQVGCDLDRATAVRGGDEALIARAAQAALAELHGGSAGRARSGRSGSLRLSVAAALALAVISASGIATAWWSGLVSWPFAREASVRQAPSAAPALQRRKPARPSERAAEPPPSPVAEPAPPAQAPRRASVRADAGELFHGANAARRSGDFPRAERLYAELIAAHPGSDESGLARVSLGKLRLARGDAAGAESEFRRYLQAGAGQLSEEALVGRAQALGKLGRTRAEREAWQRLLADYPGSVYAAQARARLLALH